MSRLNDERIEMEVAKFIDYNFWSKTSKRWQRNTSKDLQVKGVDFTVNGKNIDEKVKYYNCLNSFLAYPSFELLTRSKSGNYIEGWFSKQGQLTDYYMFISIGTDETNYTQITESDINSLSVCLVQKQEVDDFIRQQNQTVDELLKYADELVLEEPDNDGKIRKRFDHRQYWLTYTPTLHEQPVNLVIPRKTLNTFQHTRQYEITRKTVRRI